MIKLIRFVLCFMFLSGIAVTGFGQFRMRPVQQGVPVRPRSRPVAVRKIEQVKENYIGQRLNLTTDESKTFWPLYRQYVEDQTAVRILKRQNNSNNSPNGTEQIDKDLQYETELLNIRKHYKDEFLKILPPEKVSQLYKSEREFNDEVLRQLSERSVRAGN
jgi:Zn-dependent metalloprotease